MVDTPNVMWFSMLPELPKQHYWRINIALEISIIEKKDQVLNLIVHMSFNIEYCAHARTC